MEQNVKHFDSRDPELYRISEFSKVCVTFTKNLVHDVDLTS